MAKYMHLSLDRIIDPELPIRSEITPESVQDLVESISEVGILEPLLVKPVGKNFEVVAGHRRYLAATILKMTEVPVLIIKADGFQTEILKLHENLARQEISPMEWAKYLHTLKSQYDLEIAKIAELLGRSPAWVSQYLAILDYPPRLQEALSRGNIAFTSARELANIKNPATRDLYIKHAISGGITPTLAARWRREANSRQQPSSTPPSHEPDQTPSEPINLPNPICLVCSEPIEPQDLLTISIHDHCQPSEA